MIKVTVRNNPSFVSQVRNYSALDQTATTTLKQLSDVDVSGADNNEILVYDEATDKFIVKTIPIVQGGTF